MAVTELLRPQYLVNSASYRMCVQAQLSRNVCERSGIDVAKMAGESHMIETMWLSRVQRNLVCCCWRRAILHKRGGELSWSVRCSSSKIGSNRWSRPKKDIISMFKLSIRTLFSFHHSLHFCISWFYGQRWHCRRQRATWIRKLGNIARRLKKE